MIYFTSDTHFCHIKDFLWAPRGFTNVEDMNKEIVKNWNEIITDEDEVYHLGDVVMSNAETGIEFVKQLKGKIHLILGNHDGSSKIELYKQCSNIVSIEYATEIKYGKYYFFLCHYPVLVHNYDDYKKVWNIHGHTHSKEKFGEAYHCYNVCLDAHNNKPVSIENIVKDIQEYNDIRNKGGILND